jgi:hypothetical protein
MLLSSTYFSVLSVDWDYFFEARGWLGLCRACSWSKKCRGYDSEGAVCALRPQRRGSVSSSAPLDTSVDDDLGIGYRFSPRSDFYGVIHPSLLERADLFVAECHADIYPLLGEGSFVINLDSHEDASCSDTISCGSWAYMGLAAGRISHYQWLYDSPLAVSNWGKNDYDQVKLPLQLPDHFDAVFVCWSRPWTPQAEDDQLCNLVQGLSTITGTEPVPLGTDPDLAKLKLMPLSLDSH